MESAIDYAKSKVDEGGYVMLNQFGNFANPEAHYRGTAPEIWAATEGKVTHFVSSMGTTGTIMGTSRYLKEKNPDIQIIGCQPADGAKIPGIRRWPQEYLPAIYEPERVDKIYDIRQEDAEDMMRKLGRLEGVFCGISSGGSIWAALEHAKTLEKGVIVAIVCDRGDRYLSTGLFGK
jgi:cysteine synthase B